MMRCGAVEVVIVLVIVMKFEGVLTFEFGLFSTGVLVRLNASPRNCSSNLSRSANLRKTPPFMPKILGPRSAFNPILPKRAVVHPVAPGGHVMGANAVGS